MIVKLIAARTKVALDNPRGVSVAAMTKINTRAPSWVKASRSHAVNTSMAPTLVGLA
jgi:hypothetical protein